MDASIMAEVRAGQPVNFTDGESLAQINNRGDLLVAQSVPIGVELARLGNSYMAQTAAVAPVVAVPTTATLISLYNGETGLQAKSYIIDSLFVMQVVVTAAIQNVGILVNQAFSPPTVPTGTITPRCLRGLKNYGGAARVGAAVAIDATNGVVGNWFPWGSTGPGQNTLQVGTILDVPADGKLIVPPGGLLALTAIAGTATASSVILGLRWHEVLVPLP